MPLTGTRMKVTYPEFQVSLTFISPSQLRFEIAEGPFARIETVAAEVIPLGNAIFAVSWQEADGATVVNLQDHDRGTVLSFATLPDGRFLRMAGTFTVTWTGDDRPHRNRALVLEAMTSLFQRRDAGAVDRLYARDYVQHNPDIPQGRDALQRIVETLPSSVHYEPGLVIAEGDLVAIHGRIRGWAEKPQIVVDIFRVKDAKLAEHWDVLQNEAADTEGPAMFDPKEGALGG